MRRVRPTDPLGLGRVDLALRETAPEVTLTIGRRLRRRRRWMDLSQGALAARMTDLGTPILQPAVSAVELGTRKLTAEEAVSACVVLEDRAWLFGDEA